jgi:superfamily II DNA or RNA helicase
VTGRTPCAALPWGWCSAAEVKAEIARAILGNDIAAERRTAQLGSIRLLPHQQLLVERVTQSLQRHGGALLAEATGRGKTYVALAAAREALSLAVVAPAALLPMWRGALASTGMRATLVSAEAMSRGTGEAPPADFLIVDEAHHFRSRGTRRFERLRDVCIAAPTLLVTATPIHNAHEELSTLLSLFLGSAAFTLRPEELGRHVIRSASVPGGRHDFAGLPAVHGPHWLDTTIDEDVLDRIASLPQPVPPSDGGDAGALVTLSLVRQWSSSRAALTGALRRRLARAEAMADALRQGRYPGRGDMAAWTSGDDSVQLCFAGLLVEETSPGGGEIERLAAAVAAHSAAVRSLLMSLQGDRDPDDERAAALEGVLERHPGERVVAFSCFADTVQALYSRLAGRCRAGLLTGRGATVAGGALSRQEALARFAPMAQGRSEPHDAERIGLLLATDILSEGCNLQDASVVVHLDLPWTPARVEQRVGRVRRIGSHHSSVTVYMVRPPARSERIVTVEGILRRKLAVAARGVGVSGTILPSFIFPLVSGESAAEAAGALVQWAESNQSESGTSAACPDSGGDVRHSTGVEASDRGLDHADRPRRVIVGGVRADSEGWVAVVAEGGEARVFGSRMGAPATEAPDVIRDLLGRCNSYGVPDAPRGVEERLAAIRRELQRARGDSLTGLDEARLARSRRRLLRRLSRTGARLSGWRRAELLPLLAAGRRVATQVLPAGAERVLDELSDAPLAEEPWLRAVAAFTEAHARPRSADLAEPRLVAVLMLLP